jgi:putative DNA primase/helicase
MKLALVHSKEGGLTRPRIVVLPGDRPWLIDEAEEAILKNYAEWGLFQHGELLVRTTTLNADDVEKDKHIIRRKPGSVILRRATAPMLEDVFGRAIRWVVEVPDKDKGPGSFKDKVIDCPPKIASIYLSREGRWRLPPLTGIIEAPIMRPDGSILIRPGYDEATGLLLQSSVEWPAVPAPSKAAAEAAAKCLTEPFLEFPFSSDVGRSVLVSAILTGLQRRLLPTAPAHAFDASIQGAGKTIQGDCVSLLVTGREIASMTFNANEEEFRKKLMAGLIAGDAIFSVDNITKPLKSDTLASILTKTLHSDRIMGLGENRSVPTNCEFILTGNNLKFSGDMLSRAICSRIEPDCERPEERTFKIPNLRAHVLARRPQFVIAALTILQSYFNAGRPEKLKPLGRFEQWSDEIRSAIVWAGLPDPCLSIKDIIDADPERDAALAVLENWFRVLPDAQTMIQALIRRATGHGMFGDRDFEPADDDLKTALLGIAAEYEHRDKVSSARLAAWCRDRAGRIFGEYKLVRGGKAHAGFQTWQIMKLPQTQKPAEEPVVIKEL